MRGSFLLTFSEYIKGLGGGYCKITVNNELKCVQYTQVNDLFTNYIDVGDVVTVELSGSTYENGISIVRREFTTDDEEGNQGIYEYQVASTTGTTITFTVEVSDLAYEYFYLIRAGYILPPTPTPVPPTPTPVPPTPTPLPVFGFEWVVNYTRTQSDTLWIDPRLVTEDGTIDSPNAGSKPGSYEISGLTGSYSGTTAVTREFLNGITDVTYNCDFTKYQLCPNNSVTNEKFEKQRVRLYKNNVLVYDSGNKTYSGNIIGSRNGSGSCFISVNYILPNTPTPSLFSTDNFKIFRVVVDFSTTSF